mgnify:CR=1 FL=1
MSLDILAWHYSASELLWGSPKFRVLEAVVSRGAALHVDSTVLVPLQRMLEKARMWQMAAKNAISRPPPEEFDMQVIKELRNQKEHIPVKISQERRLAAMIEDEGARYCICKGPSDGSFMIGCDHCFRAGAEGVDGMTADAACSWMPSGLSTSAREGKAAAWERIAAIARALSIVACACSACVGLVWRCVSVRTIRGSVHATAHSKRGSSQLWN